MNNRRKGLIIRAVQIILITDLILSTSYHVCLTIYLHIYFFATQNHGIIQEYKPTGT